MVPIPPWLKSNAGRHWLERLLRTLTYVSSLEQDAGAILKAQSRLFSDKGTNVGSALEDLLYHRLGNDWTQRASFSWVLEQLQFASQIGTHAFFPGFICPWCYWFLALQGSKCRDTFSRALHNKLHFSGVNAHPTIQHLCLLRLLETDAKTKNPRFFVRSIKDMVLLYLLTANFEQRTNLQGLLNNMEIIKIHEFSNMHAVTANLEAIATYLVSESHLRLL